MKPKIPNPKSPISNLHLDPASDTPLYRQLYQQIRALVLAGELPAGTRLPTIRQLAQQLSLARVTVAAAYDQLEAEGYLTGRVGAGTYITDNLPTGALNHPTQPFTPTLSRWGHRVLTTEEDTREPTAPTHLEIEFGFGRPYASIFPYDVWRRLLDRYLGMDDGMLARSGSAAGFLPLRQAVAAYLERLRGVRCRPEQVVIVSGIQQALDILARLLLRAGDEVLVETPGYADAFELFRVHGARLVPLPVDDQGFPAERIPGYSRARLVFVTPSNQFPKGGAMPLARRLTLLQWAQQANALVVEDDYDGELRYSGHPLASLQGLDGDGRVVYLGTFSKVLFPALRLGYVVLPPALLDPFLHAKRLVDRGAPTLTQAAVTDFIVEGHFERHLRRLRQEYGERRRVLVECLQRYLPTQVHYCDAPAGLHVMLYLGPTCDENTVIQQAAAAGVGVYPGALYHLERPAPPSILLGFSGLSTAEIEEGVKRLAAVITS